MNTFAGRIWKCIKSALPKAGKTCFWLLKIILPISLLVRLLQYSGILAKVSDVLQPAFSLIGLPGETAIVFITSVFTPLYAPIALITSMSLGVREATILALMCLVSHNMIVECSVQAKTGSSWIGMFVLRLTMSFVFAFTLNLVLPAVMPGSIMGETQDAAVCASLYEVLVLWLKSSLSVIITILLVVTLLMILHYILDEFKLMRRLSALFAPLMKVFGLSRNSSFLWLVGNLVGLAYGSAIICEQLEEGKLSYQESNMLNYHLAVCHSLLEDSIIFASMGIPVFWLMIPRLFYAILLVWLKRLYNRFVVYKLQQA